MFNIHLLNVCYFSIKYYPMIKKLHQHIRKTMKIFRLLICSTALISLMSHICFLIKMSENEGAPLRAFFTILSNLVFFILAIMSAVVFYEKNFKEKKETIEN